ncbi:Pescadillo-like protein [Smittium mucronatum]|uniref:Pescadillo homolog n=1 Tax=Smittium mucronatum TaxID=133383 RepID=A0A1R0H8P3_9FUNG|nr:Pescadillo-like protein [Smittium mucronatum]
MGKLKKAGKEGSARKYINRNRAIKKLQVSLANFRRLCILKGVYPVEPKNRKKVNKGSTAPTTFYYTKDIQYLMHEPLLLKFREDKIFKRRLSHAKSKREWTKADGLKRHRPKYNVNHLILERYPTFNDAIRDIDDALSMLSLFAIMPASYKTGNNSTLNNSRKLLAEFMHYIMITNKLKKTFLSIKGIYYQAEIAGQTITWVAPYQFSQHVPRDVDFRVMWSFLEFYRALIGFVNCKLYKDANLVYPPKIDYELENLGVGLGALHTTKVGSLEVVQSIDDREAQLASGTESSVTSSQLKDKLASLPAKIDAIQKLESSIDAIAEKDASLEDTTEEPTTTTIADPYIDESHTSDLFKNYTFFLSREVPKYSIEFVVRSFGGKVCWEDYFNGSKQTGLNESDSRINIFIVDRPEIPKNILNRKVNGEKPSKKPMCLQPQFIYDCVNANMILSFDSYLVGKKLPPHLSPFVEYKQGDYVPKQQLAIDEYAKRIGFQGEVTTLETQDQEIQEKSTELDQSDDDDDNDDDDDDDSGENDIDGLSADEADSEDSEYDSEIEQFVEQKAVNAADSQDEDYDEHQAELEAEFGGVNYSKFKKRKTNSSPAPTSEYKKTSKIDEEKKAMAMTMMTKKNRKLYARMQNGIQKRSQEADKLNERRILAEKKQAAENNTKPAVKKNKSKSKK